MRSVRGYVGTSAVGALALLRPLLHKAMPDPAQRKRFVGRLAGTHAHEMASAVQQLLVQFDHRAGELCGAEVSRRSTSLSAQCMHQQGHHTSHVMEVNWC